MSRGRIALVSAAIAAGLDEDAAPLVAALADCGLEAELVAWDDPAVDWRAFEIAVLRSTWDYAERLGEFLAWAARASARTQLLNPLPVLRWNTDKHYLAELAARGVPVVASAFIEPGDEADGAVRAFLAAHPEAEIVVKPAVGAGSRDALRHLRSAPEAILGHAARLLASGRSALLQPYLDSVDERGETALMFVDGHFSHAIRKGPLLARGGALVAGLFAPEQVSARAPSPEELGVAQRVLAAVPYERLLYARVDLILDASGAPRLLELELTEPSFFFQHAPGSAARFARALARRGG